MIFFCQQRRKVKIPSTKEHYFQYTHDVSTNCPLDKYFTFILKDSWRCTLMSLANLVYCQLSKGADNYVGIYVLFILCLPTLASRGGIFSL